MVGVDGRLAKRMEAVTHGKDVVLKTDPWERLLFYYACAGTFRRTARGQGFHAALELVWNYLHRPRTPASEDETIEFPEDDGSGALRVLDLSYYINCPPTSGGSLRILNPLIHMSPDAGITFDFVFSTWGGDYARECEEYLTALPVVRYAKGVVLGDYRSESGNRPSDIPVDVWSTMSGDFCAFLRKLVSSVKYDIIQIEHSQLAWLAPVLKAESPDSKIVLDAHNLEYRIYETWLPYLEGKWADEIPDKCKSLKDWEFRCFPWFDAAFSVSSVEMDILKNSGIPEVYFVPTGGGMNPEKYVPREKCEKPYDILYIGSMNWYPNYHGLKWFIREVLPIIVAKHPEAILHIVGNGTPDDELVAMGRKNDNVKFWGFQEDDVAFFHGAKVFVVPLWIGAGARVKIPTAWSAKTPVVSTVFGAEGAETEPGVNIELADEPEEFAAAVLRILDDPAYGERIAENAFQTILRSYTIERSTEDLVVAYHKIAGARDGQ